MQWGVQVVTIVSTEGSTFQRDPEIKSGMLMDISKCDAMLEELIKSSGRNLEKDADKRRS